MKILALILYLLQPFQAPQLATIKTTLMSLREHLDDNRATKGAAAELTTAKHQLRDWVEFRLETFAQDGDPDALADEFHNAVKAAQLYCNDPADDCYENSLGYLDKIEVTRENGFLIVKTAVGLSCAFDYSAYVYAWQSGKWQRVWGNEQNAYTEKDYAPQTIHAVHISVPDKDGKRLVLTLGSKGGCIPAFIPIYYRLWQLPADYSDAKLLLDAKETAMDDIPPIHGKIAPDDLLIGFNVGGIAYGDSHQAIRHFEIKDERAQQVDPIATTPRDFVEEWISGEWTQSGPRSGSTNLQQAHMKVHRTDGIGDFPDPAVHCKSPDLWQIGTHYHEGPKSYYLVRWTAPYKFTMMDVKDRPFPDCTTPDPKGDRQARLFD